MRRRALALLRELPRPDVVLSTALPFSVHGAARDVARAAGALFVADNRDIWAGNPYKSTAPFYKSLERGYERRSLAAADLVVAVSEGMSAYRSEEHTSELQSLMRLSYAVFCLTKKIQQQE